MRVWEGLSAIHTRSEAVTLWLLPDFPVCLAMPKELSSDGDFF